METLNFKRLIDIPYYQLKNFPKEDALCGKENGNWKKYSTQAVIDNINKVSLALLQRGIQPDDKIGLISNNRPEWNFVDYGIMQIGAVCVPVYPTISEDDYAYILNHAEVKIIFVANKILFDKVNSVKNRVPSLKEIISFIPIESATSWNDFLQSGEQNDLVKVEELKIRVKPEQCACIIYTSGTTGFPKGVMLSHNNVISQVSCSYEFVPVGKEHRALSFLPLNHSFEKVITYIYMSHGVSIYYAESMDTIADNLKDVKPHMFTSVPLLLEKVYDRIINKGLELKGIKRALFFWAVRLGEKFDTQKDLGLWYNFQLKIARKLIFSKWLDALGGNIMIILTGAAALNERLCRVFCATGIQVTQGYGLTETSPAITVNRFNPKENMIGTVGKPLPDVYVKIADDGEILSKGPNVMIGYYKAPEKTREAIDEDGWFHTGDIGELINGEYLKITDRKKELFKTSGGKYVAPQVVENKMKESYLIESLMVVGSEMKFVSAIILPSFLNLKNWCEKNNIPFSSSQEVIKDPKVISEFKKIVDEKNTSLGHVEQIKKFTLVADEWTPINGLMTPTMKLKRKQLAEKYSATIEAMY
jgi:long-chain acyl-CoA synthetase